MNVSIHRNVWTFFVALVCACGSTGLSDGDQELLQAARRGATVEITRSLEAGASIEAADEEGKTALMLAAEGGHAEAMRVLIEAGANSVACGNLCLLFIHPPAHGSEVSPAARNTLDSARIPRASKLLICGLFLKGRVLAQDGVFPLAERLALDSAPKWPLIAF